MRDPACDIVSTWNECDIIRIWHCDFWVPEYDITCTRHCEYLNMTSFAPEIICTWHHEYLNVTYMRHCIRTLHYLHAKSRHTLHILLIEMCLAFVLALSQRDVQRLGDQNATIHLRHSLCCFFRRTEAHESEALRSTAFVHHLLTLTDQTASLTACFKVSTTSTSLTLLNKLFS